MMPYRYIFGLRDRQIVCHFHFVAWSHWSLGFHLDAASPNIEMHVPFGFLPDRMAGHLRQQSDAVSYLRQALGGQR